MIIRPIAETDLPALLLFAQTASTGLTTLQNNKAELQTKITRSLQSFKNPCTTPNNEYYLLVLEDGLTNQVVGTAAIHAKAGQAVPFYNYRVLQTTAVSAVLQKQIQHQELHLCNDLNDCSEICTLYLLPAYRKNNNGLLLSLSRFLLMANFKERFTENIFAEMRGISDEQGQSPFWNALGEKFFKLSFKEADLLTTTTNKQFIHDLMPRFPIYCDLLPDVALAVIGKAHKNTVPALTILRHEGFTWRNLIDIFDGGPVVEASRDTIKTVAESRVYTVAAIKKQIPENNKAIMSNCDLNFRSCFSSAYIFNPDNPEEINLDKNTSAALNIEVGDKIRMRALQIEKIR